MNLNFEHGGLRYENASREGLLQTGVPEAAIDAAELAAARAAADRAIDAAAEAARGRYLTMSPGMALTYAAKTAQAVAFHLASPEEQADLKRWPMLAPEAGAVGVSLTELAATVRGRDAAFSQIGGRIEAARVGGKADVRSRLKLHTVTEARDAALAALGAL